MSRCRVSVRPSPYSTKGSEIFLEGALQGKLKEGGKQACKQAGKQAGKQTGKQAGKKPGRQSLRMHSVGAMPWRGLFLW